MKKGLAYCSLLFLLSSFIISNNNNFADLIIEKLQNYRDIEWPEKVYLHTDKDLYLLNETIWFSAYLVNGITNKKSTKSAVLYVELINDRDSIVGKRKLYFEDISSGGDFKIEKEWKKGKYVLRAYTNYMRNEDPTYFFKREIDIWEVDKKDSLSILNNDTPSEKPTYSDDRPDLHFYPEGGYLVEKLTSKVAIKIKDEIYDKTHLKGYVVDEDGTLISDFKTSNYGLGYFYITPNSNKTYYANLEVNGSFYKYRLPKALPLGYNLSVSYKNDKLLIDVKTTTEKGLSNSYLIIHQRGDILFEKLETTDKTNYFISLSTNDLQDGVTHLTLFNPEGKPVCERLVFIENPKNKATIKIKKNKEVLAIKEKAFLQLNVENYIGANLPSHLSLSVRNSNTIPYNNNSENIKSWLLLNSDLRGEIKNPGYFFSETKDYKKKYLLDLVMMTNGWRRFTWQDLLYRKNKTSPYNIEKGIIISGNTKLLNTPYTLTPAYTSLTFLGEEITQQPIQKSNADGKFSFGPFIIYDSIPTIIQSRLTDFKSKEQKDRELSISINENIPSPNIIKNIRKKTHLHNKNEATKYSNINEYIRDINFQFNQNSEKLDEVVVVGKKRAEKSLREQEMRDIATFNFPSYRLDVESDETLENQPLTSLLAQFPGLNFTGRSFFIRGSAGSPKIIINDITTDLDELLSIPTDQISFIDFYRGANSAVFSDASNGVLVVYTRRGKFTSTGKRKPGIINFITKGFYTAKEFYSPDYTKDIAENSKYDLRKTLYWNPKIRITAENKTQQISFFTSDIRGDYIIEVEGISESGIPLHQISTFSVE
ncbi:Plug domain-containing protein [uncultured Winogradskyella sp.]|uniref:TonB-dependent receptor n=1 Tax=uncultured Winogradskyella sp. TaxID=395353 RepID=UPI002610A00E|nr:Plug domain-containing protein [uncultured Winogradskyella sp.]